MENIKIKNPELLKEKISKIKADGKNKLHIVSDFDRTLTYCFVDGKKLGSAYALIRDGGYLSEEYCKKAFELYDNYHEIELDSNLDIKYKSKKMKEWWEKHKQLFIDYKMNTQVIQHIMKRYPKIFRDKSLEMFDILNENNIPLLIFSSGIGNFIKGYLEKENKLTPNIYIISNTFLFDELGFVKDYENDIIHVFNKSEVSIKDKDYLNSIEKRHNVILLGDSIGDLGMTEGIAHETILRIGFLNENIEERLNEFLENFDVVLTNDQNMNYIVDLLKEII
ncbi:MAG: hypothetical protein AB7V77_02385 [Candidatus Woesearchaeota archaeon]